MTRVAIIGCGLIGRAWAISFLRGGCDVALWDADANAPGRLRDGLPATFEDLRRYGLLTEGTNDLMSRLQSCTNLPEAVARAAYVQENTPEDIASKRKIFSRLDEATDPLTVLASSTSALLPSAMFEGLQGRARCLVAHPINPPYLVPAVEIVPGPHTDKTIVTRTATFMKSLGQAPIVMQREIDGFLMNRLQGALLDEAFRLVSEGYASAEDVDIGIRDGLALRWSFMGPFETIDLNAPNGVRDYVDRYADMYSGIAAAMPGRPDWTGPVLHQVDKDRRDTLPMTDLRQRQKWRDQRLMALVEHKKNATKETAQ